MKHIRELGSLPSDAFVKYNSFTQSQVNLGGDVYVWERG